MKKTIKLTLAVVFVMGATSLFAQKFGRINTQEVISVMPEMKEMQTNIEAYSKDLQESMENIVVEYNNKYQEFNKNFSTMSDAVRQLKEKELNDLIQRRIVSVDGLEDLFAVYDYVVLCRQCAGRENEYRY